MSGKIYEEVLYPLLDTLPVELTFVDENDAVRYFNKNGDRVFPRPPSVIGKKVQDCHPKKSLHKVNQILEEFKTGDRNSAKFWIDLNGKKIYIRYFAIRDEEGNYLGCLEATQDITEIQKIEGEKRLL